MMLAVYCSISRKCGAFYVASSLLLQSLLGCTLKTELLVIGALQTVIAEVLFIAVKCNNHIWKCF